MQERPLDRKDEQRFHVIDVLRFAAAMFVLLYHFTAAGPYAPYSLVGPGDLYPHLEPITRYGFLGVEMFFLISGFVILASALGRNAGEFAISRFSRIYPTFWAGLVISIISLAIFLGPRFDLSLRQILSNVGLLQVVMREPHVDPVYWTLWVELQFYGWVFLMILFGFVQRVRIWLSVWLAITVIYAITGQPAKMALLIHPEYSSLFIAGAVFYLASREGYKPFHVIMLLVSWAVSVRFAFPHTGVYVRGMTLTDQLVSAGVVTAFYGIFLLVSLHKLRIPGSKLVMILGGLTFPLYVVHHDFGRHAINYLHPILPPYLIFPVVTAFSLGMAYVVYIVVDRRLAVSLRKSLERCSRRVWEREKVDLPES